MTDSEFMDLAERLLKAVEASCDRINDESDADIDNLAAWFSSIKVEATAP